jgi:hypothetical protein
MLANHYPEHKVEEVRQKLLVSKERWRTDELLPSGWLYRWKGEGVDKERNPASTTITYLSREGAVLVSMKAVMEAMRKSDEYTDQDVDNCREFLKSVVRFGEKRHVWLEGDETVPRGWKVRQAVKEEGVPGDLRKEYILSPEGRHYRTRFLSSFSISPIFYFPLSPYFVSPLSLSPDMSPSSTCSSEATARRTSPL